jgi:hypothetical protein
MWPRSESGSAIRPMIYGTRSRPPELTLPARRYPFGAAAARADQEHRANLHPSGSMTALGRAHPDAATGQQDAGHTDVRPLI